jgi:CRISPR system Cascade subunit CasC
MKLELHILQNFAPSNLNRDDAGAPKDCEFGGFRRARVSSQCIKRSIREAFRIHKLVPLSDMGARTKRVIDQVADVLVKAGRNKEVAASLVKFAIEGAGLKVGAADLKTQYLLFLPHRQIDALALLITEHWDELVNAREAHEKAEKAEKSANGAAKKGKKAEKAAAKAAFPKELSKALLEVVSNASSTPDLALFGRMIADRPDWNVDAACQVAHAISTNRVGMEFDYFTAVDDFRPKDTQSSDMIGTAGFNSACFYRYAVVDVEQLTRNLGENAPPALTRTTIEAFLKASALAIPRGKQNSMAAQNPPNYVLAVVRRGGAPVSLVNAFLRPVRPCGDHDLVDASIDAVESYFQRISTLYGVEEITFVGCAADRDLIGPPASDKAVAKPITRVPSFANLVEEVVRAAAVAP